MPASASLTSVGTATHGPRSLDLWRGIRFFAKHLFVGTPLRSHEISEFGLERAALVLPFLVKYGFLAGTFATAITPKGKFEWPLGWVAGVTLAVWALAFLLSVWTSMRNVEEERSVLSMELARRDNEANRSKLLITFRHAPGTNIHDSGGRVGAAVVSYRLRLVGIEIVNQHPTRAAVLTFEVMLTTSDGQPTWFELQTPPGTDAVTSLVRVAPNGHSEPRLELVVLTQAHPRIQFERFNGTPARVRITNRMNAEEQAIELEVPGFTVM